MEEIKIWRCSEDGENVEALQPFGKMNYENTLENLLVQNPEMIEPGLKIIGRQIETGSGYPDLLGLGRDNKLVVFELKRGNFTRDAVAQILDYCAWIESLNEDQIIELLTSGGGEDGIEEIEDLHTWFKNLRGETFDCSILRPTRMVLIGLGTDARAKRMVEYLADRNVDITLLTFEGYRDGKNILLARQVEVHISKKITPTSQNSRLRNYEKLQTLIEKCGSKFFGFWNDVLTKLDLNPTSNRILSNGLTRNYYKRIVKGEIAYLASHSVRIMQNCKIRVIFFPIAIHLCTNEFQQLKKDIKFREEVPTNAPNTDSVSVQWICEFDENGWEVHKTALAEIVKLVQSRWDKESSN